MIPKSLHFCVKIDMIFHNSNEHIHNFNFLCIPSWVWKLDERMLVSYHRWYIEFNPYSIKTIKKYAKDEGSWIGAFYICYLFNITHFKHWLHLGATYKESGGILLRQYHLWHKTIHFILILWSVYLWSNLFRSFVSSDLWV